jgi:Terpene synthase family 2, C-terminal metal binding
VRPDRPALGTQYTEDTPGAVPAGPWPPGAEDPTAGSPYAAGTTCAVAALGQRDLQGIADADPDLFPRVPFDAGVFATLAMANAFSAPWLSAPDLRAANRASLWAFRVDWFADHVATETEQLDRFTATCLAVADGADPPDRLTAMLANIRRDLASAPNNVAGQAIWREELRRMLAAMTVEFGWRDRGTAVSVPEYLDNADNLGSSFVNVTHWLANPEPGDCPTADVLAATRAQQRVIRVLNDLATLDRDIAWGDLNVLRLGADRAAADELLRVLLRECDAALDRVRPGQPGLATFLHRQVEFCRGFYGLTDYWGQW